MTSKTPDPNIALSWINDGQEERKMQAPAKRGSNTPKVKGPQEEKKVDAKRERFTVNLAHDVIEWARRATVFTPGQSLSGLVEQALTRELKRLEKERGEEFPTTILTPKKGRPIVLNKT
jgi:transposase